MSILTELLGDFRYILTHYPQVRKQQKQLNAKAPKAGDLAPDFTLYDPRGETSVTLSAFRGERPVALVFGSFT
jgi:peroxiredoxin